MNALNLLVAVEYQGTTFLHPIGHQPPDGPAYLVPFWDFPHEVRTGRVGNQTFREYYESRQPPVVREYHDWVDENTRTPVDANPEYQLNLAAYYTRDIALQAKKRAESLISHYGFSVGQRVEYLGKLGTIRSLHHNAAIPLSVAINFDGEKHSSTFHDDAWNRTYLRDIKLIDAAPQDEYDSSYYSFSGYGQRSDNEETLELARGQVREMYKDWRQTHYHEGIDIPLNISYAADENPSDSLESIEPSVIVNR